MFTMSFLRTYDLPKMRKEGMKKDNSNNESKSSNSSFTL